MVTEKMAARIENMPTHASQLILPKVRMLATANAMTKATATNTAVHAP
jgi:hypothetical protein